MKKQITLKELYKLYNGVCQLSLKKIPLKDACKEHVDPNCKSDDSFNIVLVSKKENRIYQSKASSRMKSQLNKSKKKLPKEPEELIRVSDGEVFYRAADGLYYLKQSVLDWPNHLHHGYDYNLLMVSFKGAFKVKK